MKNSIKFLLKKSPYVWKFLKHIYSPVARKHDLKEQQIFNEWLKENPQGIDSSIDGSLLESGPCISIIVPLYNTPDIYFWAMVKSVEQQTYKNWQLVLVDDNSTDKSVYENAIEAQKSDSRIRVIRLPENRHIAGATNAGVDHAKGEFISLLDHDDILHKNALMEVVKVIKSRSTVDFIYTDEAKLDESGNLYQPFFKPDWNFDFLRSVNYITHFTTIRKQVYLEVGGENGAYNGTQDWELFLRITRKINSEHIVHIPKILYFWRTHKNSTAYQVEAKPYVLAVQRKALEDDAKSRGVTAHITQDPMFSAQWCFLYENFTSSLEQREPGGTVGEVLSSITSDYVLISSLEIDTSNKYLSYATGDAARDDVGLVCPYQSSERTVIENLKMILSRDTVDLIETLSRRSFTKHIYMTAKYNVGVINSNTAIVETRKLRKLPPDTTFTVPIISEALLKVGCINVYNPYIKC